MLKDLHPQLANLQFQFTTSLHTYVPK